MPILVVLGKEDHDVSRAGHGVLPDLGAKFDWKLGEHCESALPPFLPDP
jgi:hypothetical protein